jgi:hypothetical protein
LCLAKEFDRTTFTELGVLIVISSLSINTLATIQQAVALRDSSSTTTNTSVEPFIQYNGINGKGIAILEGATLIDGTATPPKPNSVIIITGNKIIDVTDTTRYYNDDNYSSYHLNTKNLVVLNLTGKYIIPGLFDMHAHVAGVCSGSTKKFI